MCKEKHWAFCYTGTEIQSPAQVSGEAGRCQVWVVTIRSPPKGSLRDIPTQAYTWTPELGKHPEPWHIPTPTHWPVWLGSLQVGLLGACFPAEGLLHPAYPGLFLCTLVTDPMLTLKPSSFVRAAKSESKDLVFPQPSG